MISAHTHLGDGALVRSFSALAVLLALSGATAVAQPRQSSTAATKAADYRQTIPGSDVQFEMVAVSGGVFLMGSPDDEEGRREDEGPQVQIRVEPFWMGRHEVTWAEYQLFMELCDVFDQFNDSGVRPVTDDNRVDAVTAPSKLYDPSFTYESGDDPQQPAVSMSQYAAKQYTKWLSLLTGEFYRLPTEAEWEYACRAGSDAAYSFGADPAQLDDYGWHFENTDYATGKVGRKKPNAWGLYDMHGNVWEWVLDGYEADAYARPMGAPASTADALIWPTKLFPRVLRGGSWDSDPPECRSASRLASHDDDWRSYDPNVPQSPWWLASDVGQTIGFRIVRPQTAPPEAERSKYWDADVDSIQSDADRRIDQEGKGERGLVDPTLPEAIQRLKASDQD